MLWPHACSVDFLEDLKNSWNQGLCEVKSSEVRASSLSGCTGLCPMSFPQVEVCLLPCPTGLQTLGPHTTSPFSLLEVLKGRHKVYTFLKEGVLDRPQMSVATHGVVMLLKHTSLVYSHSVHPSIPAWIPNPWAYKENNNVFKKKKSHSTQSSAI